MRDTSPLTAVQDAIETFFDEVNYGNREALAAHVVFELKLEAEIHLVDGPKFRGPFTVFRFVSKWREK